MPSKRRGLLVLCAAAAALVPSLAQAWWNDDWQFRKELTFDLSAAGANVTGSPANVPVLVRLSLANFEFFGDTKPDGGDLRFIASDDKTALKYHIERYDPQSQIAFVWVQVPHLTAAELAPPRTLLRIRPPTSPSLPHLKQSSILPRSSAPARSSMAARA